MSDSVRPHRQWPTTLPRPWDSPGKNTGVVAISFSNAWKGKVKVKLLSRVQLFATPWSAAYQAPPSVGFSRQEYWSGVPLPSPMCVCVCVCVCLYIYMCVCVCVCVYIHIYIYIYICGRGCWITKWNCISYLFKSDSCCNVCVCVCAKHFDTKIYFYYHLHWRDESLGQNSLKTLPNVSETVKPVSSHILLNFKSLHLLYFWTLTSYHAKKGIYRFFFIFLLSLCHCLHWL